MPELAGVCSRVLPWRGDDPLAYWDGLRELSASGERRMICIDDRDTYDSLSPVERRQFLNFHTVSAAIAARVLDREPIPPVRGIGEDILWARHAVEAGYTLLHEPASIVHHMHDFDLLEARSRNVDDGVANREIIGRGFAQAWIVDAILAQSQEDWVYLEELGLDDETLRLWQMRGVLRRAAQIVGQAIGANADSSTPQLAAILSSVGRATEGASGL